MAGERMCMSPSDDGDRYWIELDTPEWIATCQALERDQRSKYARAALRKVRLCDRVNLEAEFGNLDKLFGGSE